MSFQYGLISLEKGKFHTRLNALFLSLKTPNFFAGMAKTERGVLSRWSPNWQRIKPPPLLYPEAHQPLPETERIELTVTSSIISTNPNLGLCSLTETWKDVSHYQIKSLSKFVPTQEKSQREDPGSSWFMWVMILKHRNDGQGKVSWESGKSQRQAHSWPKFSLAKAAQVPGTCWAAHSFPGPIPQCLSFNGALLPILKPLDTCVSTHNTVVLLTFGARWFFSCGGLSCDY